MDTLYAITYSNHFAIENRIFAFRKKLLFDITDTPKYIELKNNSGSNGYWINRKWYSLTKLQGLVIKEPKAIDVSSLQWYEQINLDECFNLQ